MCSFMEHSLVIFTCDLWTGLWEIPICFLLRSQCISKKLLTWIVFFWAICGTASSELYFVSHLYLSLGMPWENFVKASCICKENYPRCHSITSSPSHYCCSQVTVCCIFLLEFGSKEIGACLEEISAFLRAKSVN